MLARMSSSSEADPKIHDIEPLTSTQIQLYKDKISVLGFDPYTVDKQFFSIKSVSAWPNISFPDLFNYFVLSTSTFTQEQIKAYKSLQAYSYFVVGWIQEILVGKNN